MPTYKDLLQEWRDIYWKWVLENKDKYPHPDTITFDNHTEYDSVWFWQCISGNPNISWETIYTKI